MPFEEIAHTADWSLRVWAEDAPGLFADAARGMYALAGARPVRSPETGQGSNASGAPRSLRLSAPDLESLLVAFLSELVYAMEQEHLVFENFRLEIEDHSLKVEMDGAPFESLNKVIKAVTYHNLHIRQTARGYETEIVFDV